MKALTTVLALLAAVGAAARLLPSSLCTLPFVPDVVSAEPWFALGAVVSLLLSFVPVWHEHRTLRLFVRILTVSTIALQVSWQLPFFVPSARVSAATSTEDASSSAAGSNAADVDGSSSSTAASPTLRVMTCNVYKGAADAATVVELVRAQGIQVLALQETTTEFVEQMEAAGLNELLPYSMRSSSDGVYGNGVWSATPLADTASDDIGSSASAMPAGSITVELADGTTTQVRFVSVHTCSPVAGYWDLWKQSIDELSVVRERLAEDSSLNYVLMGDFNATYDHAPFRDLLAAGSGCELHDAARETGQGVISTWPANKVVPAFCAIDHVVSSESVVATSVTTATVPGADHLALIATLQVS